MPMQASKNINVNTLDHVVTDGLEGTVNSLSYRIGEIERHLHGYERWYGASAGQVGPGLATSNLGFRATTSATVDTFGTAIVVFDGTETYPSGAVKFDPHRIHVLNVQTAAVYRLRVAYNRSGEASYAAAVANGNYSDMIVKVDATNADFVPIVVMARRLNIGAKIWAAAQKTSGVATATFDFMIGIHCYEG